MSTRRPALVLLLLVATLALAGCHCVQDVYCGTKQAAVEQYQNVASPCCPDPCGNVYSTPIYSSGCSVDPRVGSGGHGALKTP